MRICVAAICRNEEKNMEQWLKHVSCADAICVVDTGSTDRTPEILMDFDHPELHIMHDHTVERNLGASRNLAATPFSDNDLIVWIDIDERFSDPNWAETLRQTPGLANADRVWITMHNGDSVYGQTKAYKKRAYSWKYRAHEVLSEIRVGKKTRSIEVTAFHTDHFPDFQKPRSYLLDLANDVRDFPRDERASFYYARELCYAVIAGNHDIYRDAVQEVKRLSAMCLWDDYKTLAHTELLRAAYMVQDTTQVIASGYAALAARPDRIEAYGSFADAFYRLGDCASALGLAVQGINCNTSQKFLFDSSQSNLELCLELAYRSCEALGLIQQALYYLAQYATHRGEDVNQSISESGLVEKLVAQGTGTIPENAPSIEVEGDGADEETSPDQN